LTEGGATVPRLIIKDGPNRGAMHQIGVRPILLGRETDCSIQILDKGTSRHHAEIFRVGEMCFIRDLGSRNGTYVNEERVHEELLREGDRVTIGSTTVVFEADRTEPGPKNIQFTEGDEEEMGSTLELRLDDLAGLEEEEDRDTANFRAIYQLGRLLGHERSVEAAQEKALAFLAELVPAEQIYLFSRDPATGSFVPRARYERDPSSQGQVSRTIIKRCLAEFRSIMTTNAMSDARFKGNESVVLKGIRSVICVPMLAQGDVSGALYMSSSRVAEPFVEEDLELVTAAGTLLGLTAESLETARRQRETLFSAMRALVALGEVRDPALRGHSERVASYAQAIAMQMGLPERQRVGVRLAALLHDIGKASVPGSVLADRDSRMFRRGEPGTMHAALGAEVADSIAGAEDVPAAIRHHHERHDGSGYPDGLAGDAIPIAARIVSAADILDHIAVSGGDLPLVTAVDMLQTKAGRELDPEVVRACEGACKAGLLEEPATLFEGVPETVGDASEGAAAGDGPGGPGASA
jgi:putative nucleotidyltransferase with HDIG domain